MPSDAFAARTGPWFPDVGQAADTRSDAELVAAVRSGDSSAFAALWTRHHPAVLRYALQFPPRSNAEDLVSEAFARLLRVLQAGGGPDMNVRPYLLTAVKRLRIDLATRYERRVGLTDDDSDLEVESADPAEAKAMEGLEASMVWKAYSELPERWQLVLWHTLIEEQPAAEVATILGSSPNAIAALSMRAREGLRQAFLQAHVARSASTACVPVLGRLGAWQRRALSNREAATVSTHLDGCPRCRSAAAEVSRLNQSLRSIVLPAVLGGVASAAAFLSDAAERNGLAPSTAAAHRGPHHPRPGHPKEGAHRAARQLGSRLRAELKPLIASAAASAAVVATLTALATPSRAQRVRIAALRVYPADTAAPEHTAAGEPTTVVVPTLAAPSGVGTPSATSSLSATASPAAAAGTASGVGADPTATAPGSPSPEPAGAPATGTAATERSPSDRGTTPAPSGSVRPTVGPEESEGNAVRSPSAAPTSATDLPAATRSFIVQVVAGYRDTAGSVRVTVPPNWQLVSVSALTGDVCVRASDQEFDCTVAPLPAPGKHLYAVSAASQQPVSRDVSTVDYISGGHLQRHRYDLT